MRQPLATIAGRPPDPAAIPAGCAFASRCPYAGARCAAERPVLEAVPGGGQVACWYPLTPEEPARQESAAGLARPGDAR